MRLIGLVALLGTCFGLGFMGYDARRSVALAPEQPKAEPLAVPPEIDIQGIYLASGRTPDGTQYKGVLVTIRKVGKGLRFQWNVENHQCAIGIGVRNGSDIAIGMAEFPAGLASVCRYKIEAAGPKLIGMWMQPDGTTGEETLNFLSKLP